MSNLAREVVARLGLITALVIVLITISSAIARWLGA